MSTAGGLQFSDGTAPRVYGCFVKFGETAAEAAAQKRYLTPQVQNTGAEPVPQSATHAMPVAVVPRTPTSTALLSYFQFHAGHVCSGRATTFKDAPEICTGALKQHFRADVQPGTEKYRDTVLKFLERKEAHLQRKIAHSACHETLVGMLALELLCFFKKTEPSTGFVLPNGT